MWLEKVRKKWKEEPHFGKRYSILRKSKHRAEGHCSLTEVAGRLGLQTSTLQKLELGALDVIATTPVLVQAVADLGIPMPLFLDETQEAKPKGDPLTCLLNSKKAAAEVPSKKAVAVKSKKEWHIINHREDSFLIRIDGNVIELFEDIATNKKKGVRWVAPADVRFGKEVVGRKTILKW